MVQKEKLQPLLVPTEADLLRSLFDVLANEDPDAIIGHNLVGNDLPVLHSRLLRLKLNRSKLGRLKRSSPLIHVAPNDLPAALLSGRLCVDSYDSAKELTHEEDYSLSFLAGKYAKLSIREFENQQVGVAASCERRFPSCFRTHTVSVDCSSRCW